MTEQEAEMDYWERTMQLRWLMSPTPGERPTLQQKWTRQQWGYLNEQWIDVEEVEK